MAYRCPAAQVVGPVVLEGYELLFRGNASGNGVATIKPKEGQQVHGLLWRITPGCERSLDLYEGYPHLYEKESVAVRDNAGRQLTVMAYVMTDGDRWRSPALPSEYYYQGIRDGYRQNGLPLSKLKQAWEYCASPAVSAGIAPSKVLPWPSPAPPPGPAVFQSAPGAGLFESVEAGCG